jgi:RNA polymerase sigma-70 factor (ECF subfamily)
MDANPEALMSRYQAGDLVAASSLIERVSPNLHRYLAAQSASRGDADDLLQEVWLRIHRVRHTYQPGKPLLPWVYAIARRVRIDHYRRTFRTSVREQRWEDLRESADCFDAESAQATQLQELLAPLSQSEREVLQMMKISGMSLEEVARATACSVGSVKQKVHRAYGKLRRTMSLAGTKRQTGMVS